MSEGTDSYRFLPTPPDSYRFLPIPTDHTDLLPTPTDSYRFPTDFTKFERKGNQVLEKPSRKHVFWKLGEAHKAVDGVLHLVVDPRRQCRAQS